MALTIRISGVKNIKTLDFRVPEKGVFVLTGENGSGKTTLLACLARIGVPDSFPRHFRTSNVSSKLDQFSNARVEYVFADTGYSVTYAYSGTRWEPSPKKNSANLLKNSGFSEVLYVAADEARVTPRREDFSPNRIKAAPAFVQLNADAVLGTKKFSTLKTVNVKKGWGQQAFVLETSPQTYVSERNFSLGELAIVKLFRTLESCKQGALLVIDELELALHPIAQERLLRVLQTIAKQKELTVLFSTHSATLIRSVSPSHLLFLEPQGNGLIRCISPCYPTYALGRIAPPTDLKAEIIVLVEDQHAQTMMQALMRKAITRVFPQSVPSIVCQPVGGFGEVLRFFARSASVFGAGTKTSVVLDADCQSLFVVATAAGGKAVSSSVAADLRQIYQQNQSIIRFLGETPEVGVVNEIATAGNTFLIEASTHFVHNGLLAVSLPANVGPSTSSPSRKAAKSAFAEVSDKFRDVTGRSEEEVRRFLYEWYVDRLEKSSAGQAAAILGPLIS